MIFSPSWKAANPALCVITLANVKFPNFGFFCISYLLLHNKLSQNQQLETTTFFYLTRFLRIGIQKWLSRVVWAHILASNAMAVELSARAAAVWRLPWVWKTLSRMVQSHSCLQEAQFSFLSVWAPVQRCLNVPSRWQQLPRESDRERQERRREGRGIPLLTPGFSSQLLSKVFQGSLLTVKWEMFVWHVWNLYPAFLFLCFSVDKITFSLILNHSTEIQVSLVAIFCGVSSQHLSLLSALTALRRQPFEELVLTTPALLPGSRPSTARCSLVSDMCNVETVFLRIEEVRQAGQAVFSPRCGKYDSSKSSASEFLSSSFYKAWNSETRNLVGKEMWMGDL